MQIDRVLYPISTLGPGERLIIWTVGCSKHCHKCANPELWNKDPNKEIDVFDLAEMITKAIGKQAIDGVTITGGDPVEQIDELNKLLPLLREVTDDVLLYTGFTAQEVEMALSKSDWETMKKHTSVLIDGAYIDDLNDNECALRGSLNQNIIYFDEAKKEPYSAYLKKKRKIQNAFYNEKMISVGIHNKDLYVRR
ncbi:MAG: radical SAM protein [Treponema sp.]|jgi:anaerobic ribonucleoside-triphosphate reductase activating protein|nr:radical SAM protein [Treponema sp.]